MIIGRTHKEVEMNPSGDIEARVRRLEDIEAHRVASGIWKIHVFGPHNENRIRKRQGVSRMPSYVIREKCDGCKGQDKTACMYICPNDLMILDKNPLQDIRNTLSIRYVMKNGFLYSGETLDIVWPAQRSNKKAK